MVTGSGSHLRPLHLLSQLECSTSHTLSCFLPATISERPPLPTPSQTTVPSLFLCYARIPDETLSPQMHSLVSLDKETWRQATLRGSTVLSSIFLSLELSSRSPAFDHRRSVASIPECRINRTTGCVNFFEPGFFHSEKHLSSLSLLLYMWVAHSFSPDHRIPRMDGLGVD